MSKLEQALVSLAVVLFLVAVVYMPNTNAVTRVDEVNISVTVNQKTLVDVTPTSLVWSNVDPGSEDLLDDDGYGSIQVENIGSTNISYVFFNNTYPTTDPFGSGTNASYDAGNFVVLKRNSESGVNAWAFPNRMEYNASQQIVYLTVPAGYYYGRFRNASHEYFWAVDAGSGECNATGRVFRIGIDEHNQSATGSVDFTNAAQYRQYSLDNADNNNAWGWAAINVSNLNWTMCVAVKNTCDQAMFYRWNIDAPGGSECGYAENFTSSTLTPGAWILANIGVRVPYGVHWGTTGAVQGKVTVVAYSTYAA
ncbi:MAG: hypothetical protein JW716_00120 [Candidatus Aenigmarchaeota archaeon]|nr:hypothetical protein [Candidatus Aenigmarchaeota archaeon]